MLWPRRRMVQGISVALMAGALCTYGGLAVVTLWNNRQRAQRCSCGTASGTAHSSALPAPLRSSYPGQQMYGPRLSSLPAPGDHYLLCRRTMSSTHQSDRTHRQHRRHMGPLSARGSRTRAETVLVLFIESGALYCLLWVRALPAGLSDHTQNPCLSRCPLWQCLSCPSFQNQPLGTSGQRAGTYS